MAVRRLAVLLLALGILDARPGEAQSQIQVVGQDRRASSSVLVTGNGDSDFDQLSEVAPDLGPFDVHLFTDAEIPSASSSATAIQRSQITAYAIVADGLATGHAQADSLSTAYASAQSNVAIRFTLETDMPYAIEGFVDATANATATFQLSRPFETIAWYSGDGGPADIYQLGLLQPGTYDLNITCSGGATAPDLTQGTASYDVVFELAPILDAPASAADRETLRAAPNPFRAATRLTVPEGTREVRILDVQGRLVRTLRGAGELVFDGADAAGRPLSGGVYWMKAVGDRDFDAARIVRLR